MQVNGLGGAGSKTAGIKMAQKMDSFSINIKNEIARKQKEQQEISSNKSLSAEEIVSICIPDEYFGNTKSKDC